MTIRYSGVPQWRRMATLEVADEAKLFAALVDHEDLAFRLDQLPTSPPGYKWFDLLIDASGGERRCSMTAYIVLSELSREVTEACIPGFRIVNGRQWLVMGDNNTSSQIPDTPGEATRRPFAAWTKTISTRFPLRSGLVIWKGIFPRSGINGPRPGLIR